MRGAKSFVYDDTCTNKFQSTLPMRGAIQDIQLPIEVCNFNPRSPCGERSRFPQIAPGSSDFNPRSPCGERTFSGMPPSATRISIHAPHAGSESTFPSSYNVTPISIHAPHAGSEMFKKYAKPLTDISIHAPHAGSDQKGIGIGFDVAFQSTLPMRGATDHLHEAGCRSYFNPRSPCGERLKLPLMINLDTYFNPRSPCGERFTDCRRRRRVAISIHAPHAGSEGSVSRTSAAVQDFNPRSPCGERDY